MKANDSNNRRSRRGCRVVILVVLVAAAAVRAAAIFNEPWLDELWSRGLAAHATSPLQILTANEFRVDNNHWLNTLYLYALGDRAAWWPRRLLSLATGTATVGLAAVVARRWGRWTAAFAATLTGFSFMAVQYASEARGYAPAACFATAGLWAARRFVAGGRRRGWAAAAFGGACVLGLLAHASFVYALAGAGVYAPFALWRAGRRGKVWAVDLALLFATPLCFGGWLYWTAARGMRIAGGPRWPYGRVLAETFTFAAGLPLPESAGWIGLALAAAAAAYGAIVLARRGHDEWVFLVTAGLVAPALILLIDRPQPLYPRYLFVALPFVLLLTAVAVRDVLGRGPSGVVVGTVVLAAFLVGNGLHLRRFYAVGRGQNRAMLDYLVARTPGPVIPIAAAQKFRMAILFDYFTPRVAMAGKAFHYVPPQSPQPPEWFLIDTDENDPPTRLMRVGVWPDAYDLAAVFPHYGLSGSDWQVYRRRPAPPAASPGRLPRPAGRFTMPGSNQ